MTEVVFNLECFKSCGENVFVSGNVEIRRPHLISIGRNVAIDTGFYCTTAAEIGDYIHIAPYVTIIGGKDVCFKMGNFTTIAAGSRIICSSDEHNGAGFVGPTIPDKYRDKVFVAPVMMEDFSSLATNVVVAPGVTIGQGSVVGANSFVKKDTAPWTFYAGSPAKPIKERPHEKMFEYAQEMGYQIEKR